jgi:hypothetical protein
MMLPNQNRDRAPPLAAKNRAASRPDAGKQGPLSMWYRAKGTN